nr:MAG TPA: hypothetical protein [Caudoviricetes sp.]
MFFYGEKKGKKYLNTCFLTKNLKNTEILFKLP